MIPPRPTMSPEDVKALREFMDSPAGRSMIGEINRAIDTSPAWIDPDAKDFWRDSSTGERLEVEAACADPLDPPRPFPVPRSPNPVAHQASPWPVIIATILSTTACATLIAWFVSAALKAHA